MNRAVWLLVSLAPMWGQGIITTVAGGADWVFPGDGKPALEAPLGRVADVAIDPTDGRPVFADPDNCIVGKIKADGELSVLAGNGFCLTSGDGGPATDAALKSPSAVAYDGVGNLYIGTSFIIRKVSTDGTITTLKGTESKLTETTRGVVISIAVDRENRVYWTEDGVSRIFIWSPQDQIRDFFAGTGEAGYAGDGQFARSATLNQPTGLALDAAGNLYVADAGNRRIRKISDGIIATVFSSLNAPDGFRPRSVAVDSAGTMYVNDSTNLLKASPPAALLTLVAAVGPGSNGAAPDHSGNVYVADGPNSRLVKVSGSGPAATVAGNGKYRYNEDGVRALDSFLNEPRGLTIGVNQHLYIGGNERVYEVDSEGLLSTVIKSKYGGKITTDPRGNLYAASPTGGRIVRIDAARPTAVPSDYATVQAGCLAFDRFTDNLYASCSGSSQILKVDSSGKAAVYAGTNVFGFSGDNGVATHANFGDISDLAVDSHGNVIVADTFNRRVRQITTGGFVSTIAGNGFEDLAGGAGDGGPATLARLSSPVGLDVDNAGNVYIADSLGLVRKVTPAGMISTVAGSFDGYSGDGRLATRTALDHPSDVAVDLAGNLYITEGNRVRKVLVDPPTIQVLTTSVSFYAASGGAPVSQAVMVTGDMAGLEFDASLEFDESLPPSWLLVDPESAATPRRLTLTADPGGLPPGSYHAKLVITPNGAIPSSLTIDVTLEVGPAQAPRLFIDKSHLSFTALQGGTDRPQSLVIANHGGGALKFTAATSTSRGGNWLSLSLDSGQALPGKPSGLIVSANSSGLKPGTYTGAISIETPVDRKVIPVSLTISSSSQALALTQSGMSFTAVQNGGVIPPQSFGVVNLGAGVMHWTASTSTTEGPNWIRVSPASGSSSAGGTAPEVTVTVIPQGLKAGTYYGTILIKAPSSTNKSAVITVFLEVLADGTATTAMIQPPELVFYTGSTQDIPGSQVLHVYNVTSVPRSFTSQLSSVSFETQVLPGKGALDDPQEPLKILVQPTQLNRSAAILTDALAFQFSDGTVQTVKLTVINSAEVNSTPSSKDQTRRTADADCTPKELAVSLNSFSSSYATFKTSAGWPVALSVDVSDNCHQPLLRGDDSSVVVTMEEEDDVVMNALGDGTWQGTWKPRKPNPNAKLRIVAHRGNVSGETSLTGSLYDIKELPAFTTESVLSAFATSGEVRPLAPGALLSIYSANGSQLANTTQIANASESPVLKLGDVQVFFNDDLRAPLSFVSPGQLNVTVPWYGLWDTGNYVRIRKGGVWSTPVAVDIADAQPVPLVIGGNLWALDYPADGSPYLVTSSTPAKSGDLIELTAVGLGRTDTARSDGSPQDLTVSGVLVSVGGSEATEVSVNLKPDLSGIYRVLFRLPLTNATGTLPITITVAGQSSSPANLLVEERSW